MDLLHFVYRHLKFSIEHVFITWQPRRRMNRSHGSQNAQEVGMMTNASSDSNEFHEIVHWSIQDRRVRVGWGDITRQTVDAIVNPANEFLQHGGGVAGAIVRRGGSVIQEESNRWGYLPVGNAITTGAGSLPARFVIHTVGPRGGESHADEKLFWAIWSSLREAERVECASIAIPPVSTGIFGFPKNRGCKIIASTVNRFLREWARTLTEVRLIDLDEKGAQYFLAAAP